MSNEATRFFALAERLSEAQTGLTGGNPSVGAVLVKNGRVIGRGATANGGRPHAETQALDEAGKNARGADLYVTLEPCAHTGGTPPCADAVIKAGVARVFCSWRDPNPKVNAQGFEKLQNAGIEVVRVARPLPDGLRYFFTNQRLGRPFVALKLATSLDGKIALKNGESQWISCAQARRFTRSLRARYHGIGVGVGTVLGDNPKLTTRLAGLRNPRPVIFDQQGRTPQNANIFAGERAVVISQGDVAFENTDHVAIDPHDLRPALSALLDEGVSSLLLEGGAGLAASFLRVGLVDRIYHVATGAVMGADAHSAFGALHLDDMAEVPRGEISARWKFGSDTLLQYDFAQLDAEDLRA